MPERPKLCPEEECKPFFNKLNEEWREKGGSGTCVGIMDESVKFVYKEVEHVNDCSYCVFTPLKGVIRFMINGGDLWGDIVMFTKLLDKIEPIECSVCDAKGRFLNRYVVVDKVRYCYRCALRLGLYEWDEKDKRYVFV